MVLVTTLLDAQHYIRQALASILLKNHITNITLLTKKSDDNQFLYSPEDRMEG